MIIRQGRPRFVRCHHGDSVSLLGVLASVHRRHRGQCGGPPGDLKADGALLAEPAVFWDVRGLDGFALLDADDD